MVDVYNLVCIIESIFRYTLGGIFMHREIHKDVKTSIILKKDLLEEIDRNNPFATRKEFLDQACRVYLKELKRRSIDEKLAVACKQAAMEDGAVNKEWESVDIEDWK